MIARLTVLALVVLLGGCTRWTYDLGEPLAQTDVPAKGTPLGEVIARLGPPLRLSATPQGYVMAWEHWVIGEDSLGLSLGPLGLDLLALDLGAARVSGEFLVLQFDRNRQLADASFSTWNENAGQGAALQPSFGLVEVVDVSDLTGALPTHRWGALGLKPLPESLNTHSPESGQDGLEQRGTPRGAGQRTLEYDD
ncbi:hypothetical protein A3709_11155 [Halioglobus sp. HI00S01]|uniref:hypothetical protein n=1 Tax=Halioglobus sp. HI00S01 TaxID=1822214 RepID=UPI0007C32999|nr:hypothetical protein [Halioglobus sp. HI00S01]KZX50307.1 hypothetical protein A3709_11155 [Halioglobus sp. HI00S01]